MQAYERGVSLFKWPHIYDIWNTYLTKFIKRYVSVHPLRLLLLVALIVRTIHTVVSVILLRLVVMPRCACAS